MRADCACLLPCKTTPSSAAYVILLAESSCGHWVGLACFSSLPESSSSRCVEYHIRKAITRLTSDLSRSPRRNAGWCRLFLELQPSWLAVYWRSRVESERGSLLPRQAPSVGRGFSFRPQGK